MASSYPGGLDNLPTITETTNMDDAGFEGDVVITNIADAVEAVQGELGTTPSGSFATVKERLDFSEPVLVLDDGEAVPASTPVNTVILRRTATGGGGDHNALQNLTVGNPHTQYQLVSEMGTDPAGAFSTVKERLTSGEVGFGVSKVGYYLPPLFLGGHITTPISSTTGNSQGEQRYMLFAVKETVTVDRLSIRVTVAATDAGSIALLALYRSRSEAYPFLPGTLLGQGSVGVTTTGQKDLDITPVQLTPGLYVTALGLYAATAAGTNPVFDFNTIPFSEYGLFDNNIVDVISRTSQAGITSFPSENDWAGIISNGQPRVLPRRSA